MKTNPVTITLLVFLFNVPQFSRATTVSKDEEEIRNLVETQQQEAWNKHDPKAYAGLFTGNGDCVNVVGWWWKGRAEIEQKLTAAYAFVFRESVLTITNVNVRLLTPTVAIAHVHWTTTGARTPQGYAKVQQGYPDTDPDKIKEEMVDCSLPKHNRYSRDAISAGAASVYTTTQRFAVSRSLETA